ncbi:histidinol dehydrogenase [Flavobacterium zepuense]|uniref:Histidinol dehydrogenase n=1 Tax=Flavobacterium zepuense TaxID=2593302 RepID=A0A552VA06_9FLAO|nr:histidinol dehydrogenase [Flavobacterium zepuense]TRW27311.1 histidinol dehydrogenase [Flavobacterium zepuense]
MIQKIINPDIDQWQALCERPALPQLDVQELVQQIFTEIKRNGDEAVKKYTGFFDDAIVENVKVSAEAIDAVAKQIPNDLKRAIHLAKSNIEKFHTSQQEDVKVVETTPGVECWRESRPIERVGIYIPGGSAPLFSTVLMLGIPAKIAGCKEIILCSPPDKKGNINPAILYTAQLVGITAVYAIGGIQAIGAMAIGTESITRVDKIFGPGNQYVTAAKQAALNYGVAIDLPAGPSEVLVIADATCNPEFVAADLLSQAEHGADSQVILLSDNEQVTDAVIKALESQTKALPRKETVLKCLQNSKAIVLETINECVEFSNLYAPEHLIIASDNAEGFITKITTAGSVFLGNYSCESAGDYASGTNHTLPTNGYAKSYSGVSLDSFVKKITFQKISAVGLQNIGPAIELMAAAEQLEAHKNAVTIRLKSLNNV